MTTQTKAEERLTLEAELGRIEETKEYMVSDLAWERYQYLQRVLAPWDSGMAYDE